jgi:hypothetical protein
LTKILTNPYLLSRLSRLFEKCPQAKVLFGFPIDIDPTSPELLTSKRFIMHAAYLIQMIDTALNMLGPDIELLTEIMTELGLKHVRYGGTFRFYLFVHRTAVWACTHLSSFLACFFLVKPEMFPIMGDALILTLETTLKGDFTDPIREAWIETYSALSQDMIRAQIKAKRKGSKTA